MRKIMHHTFKTGVQRAVRLGWSAFLFLLLIPQSLFADPACPVGKLCNPLRFDNLITFLLEIVTTAIQYGAILIVFFVVFAGFKFVTAQGNSEKVSEARKMLTWVVVGAFVLLGVYVIKAAICGTIANLGVNVDAACKPKTTTP